MAGGGLGCGGYRAKKGNCKWWKWKTETESGNGNGQTNNSHIDQQIISKVSTRDSSLS